HGVLRPVTPDDFSELSARLPSVLSGDWSVAALEASPYRQRVLVKDDAPSILLGFAEFYLVADECHLLEIAVWTELQGKGLGKQLLTAVLDEARAEGCTLCLLEVRRSNEIGRASCRERVESAVVGGAVRTKREA